MKGTGMTKDMIILSCSVERGKKIKGINRRHMNAAHKVVFKVAHPSISKYSTIKSSVPDATTSYCGSFVSVHLLEIVKGAHVE